MQLSQGPSQTPVTWTEADVEQCLASLSAVQESQHLIIQHQVTLIDLASTLIVLAAAILAWKAFGLFLPNTRQIVGES